MYRMKFVSILMVVFSAALLSGCAMFEGGNIAKTDLVPMEGEVSKPSVSYTTLARGGLSEVKDLPENSQSIIEKEFLQVLNESGYFSQVSQKSGQADIKIDVTVTDTGNPAALVPAVITGLSLYTIPSWATDNWEVLAKVSNSQGKSKEYKLNDSTTIVQWLPMVFVFPAKNFSVVPEVRKNMYRNLIMQMKDDGFLANGAAILGSTH